MFVERERERTAPKKEMAKPPLRLMNLFRAAGGIPFDFDFQNPESKSGEKIQLLKPLLVIAILLAPLGLGLCHVERLFGSPFAIGAMGKAMGVSAQDGLLPIMLFMFGLSTSGCFLQIFVLKRKRIARIYCTIAKLERECHWVTEETVRDKWGPFVLWIIIGTFCSMSSGVCYGLVSHGLFVNVKGSFDLSFLEWLSVITMAASVPLVVVHNVSICAGFMLCIDVMVSLGDILLQWKCRMLDAIHASKSLKEHDTKASAKVVKHEISFAEDICKLTEAANGMLAPFVLLAYTYLLVGAVLYTYGAFGMLFNSADQKLWTYFAGNLLLAVVMYFSALFFSYFGNCLQTKRDQSMALLHELLLKTYVHIDGATLFEGTGVLARMDKVIRISPYDFFEVSNTNFLGVIATHATYIIVALQFRAA